MTENHHTLSFNTILYCRRFEATVRFYRDGLSFTPVLVKPWFVEFAVNALSRISVADESRASVKSSGGLGVTLTFQLADLDAFHARLTASGFEPGRIMSHPWGARLFHILDPEGHRLEFWSPVEP